MREDRSAAYCGRLYLPDRMRAQIIEALMGKCSGRLYGTIYEKDRLSITATDFILDDSQECAATRLLICCIPYQEKHLPESAGLVEFRYAEGLLKAVLRNSATTGQCAGFVPGEELEIVSIKDCDFFKRTPFDTTIVSHLAQKRILVVGLGSVGSVMAKELASAGVGRIIGVDKDVMEIHNCMRHLLGPAYVGWPKAMAMGHYLREAVPSCQFIYRDCDFFGDKRQELRDFLDSEMPTHIIAVTDVLKVQYECQRIAFEYEIPFMAVWCDNNAIEGEIFLWEPGQASGWRDGREKRGCYACLRPMDQPTITRSSHFDYSTDDPDSYGGEPALGMFINRVNAIASIFMLAWLLTDCPHRTKLAGILDREYNVLGLQYVRLGGPYSMEGSTLTAKNPWGVEWYRVSKSDECPICINKDANRAQLFRVKSATPDEWLDPSESFDEKERVETC